MMASSLTKMNISKEEVAFRKKYKPNATLLCTICSDQIEPEAITDTNIHPRLLVLVCEECRVIYDQNYHQDCTWCAKRFSKLYRCHTSNCPAKFCIDCISRNFRTSRSILEKLENGTWYCYICNPEQLWAHRAACAIANESKKRRTPVQQPETVNKSRVPSSAPVQRSVGCQVSCLEKKSVGCQVSCLEKKSVGCQVSPGRMNIAPSNNCVICLSEPACMLLDACGHKCVCEDCRQKYLKSVTWSFQLQKFIFSVEWNCPICRKPFRTFIRVYD